MADPLLQDRYPVKGLYQALAVAAMCLQEEASTRPLISDVVTALAFLSKPEDNNDNINIIDSPRHSVNTVIIHSVEEDDDDYDNEQRFYKCKNGEKEEEEEEDDEQRYVYVVDLETSEKASHPLPKPDNNNNNNNK